MNKILLLNVVLCSIAFAKAPGEADLANQDKNEARVRMRYVLGLAEALELNEAESLKLAEKLKVLSEKRKPVRIQLGEARRAIKAAAEGDMAAQAQVDVNIQKIFDLQTQMAVLNKEMYQVLAKDLSPQKKARLSIALGQLAKEPTKPNEGRRHRR
jgi:hypothetical protein